MDYLLLLLKSWLITIGLQIVIFNILCKEKITTKQIIANIAALLIYVILFGYLYFIFHLPPQIDNLRD